MPGPPRSPYPPDLTEGALPDPEADDLVDTVAADRDWAGRRVRGFSARRVSLRRCRLTGAELAEAALLDVTFEECRLDVVGLRHATLERVVFRDCPMNECDLYGASLRDVAFERCDLREATFSAAHLQRVELRGCLLDGLRGAEALKGARIPWIDLPGHAGVLASALGLEIVDQADPTTGSSDSNV